MPPWAGSRVPKAAKGAMGAMCHQPWVGGISHLRALRSWVGTCAAQYDTNL